VRDDKTLRGRGGLRLYLGRTNDSKGQESTETRRSYHEVLTNPGIIMGLKSCSGEAQSVWSIRNEHILNDYNSRLTSLYIASIMMPPIISSPSCRPMA